MEITLNIQTESELTDYILHQLGVGSVPRTNPFIAEYGDAEIIDVDVL